MNKNPNKNTTTTATTHHHVHVRAIISGLLGATSSCLAKLALDPQSPLIVSRLPPSTLSSSSSSSSSSLSLVTTSLIPRGVCLLIMVGCNVVMIGTFIDGMTESGSVAATALSNASNFAFSAVLGILFFDESVNEVWMVGFVMIVLGVWLLSGVTLKEATNKND